MRETSTHIYFWGSFLSNFYLCQLKDDKYSYNSSECYFMAKKAEYFNDQESLIKILNLKKPQEQKQVGKKVKGFNKELWEEVSYKIMLDGLRLKFTQNNELKNKLLATNNKTLVEGSPYDKKWGVGLKYDDDRILDESNWQGDNLLGKALMEIREEIKKNEKKSL